jgi:glutamine amidotransferase
VSNSEPSVAVLDFGTGDISALVDLLETTGVTVAVTSDRDAVMNADGLIVTGDADTAAAMRRLRETRGDELIERRLAGGRPVLAVAVGMHILFDRVLEDDGEIPGLGQWPGTVREVGRGEFPGLLAVDSATESALFAGLAGELFYFDNPRAATAWTLEAYGAFQPPLVSYATSVARFIAAVENGPLSAVQFQPEQSGDAGAQLLRNWLGTL